jgi:hypothetical protein
MHAVRLRPSRHLVRLLEPGLGQPRAAFASRVEHPGGSPFGDRRGLSAATGRTADSRARLSSPVARERALCAVVALWPRSAGTGPIRPSSAGLGASHGTQAIQQRHSVVTRSACLLLLAVSAACGTATPAPLPSGPPPEYEPARGYQPPAGNIDSVATASAAATADASSAGSSSGASVVAPGAGTRASAAPRPAPPAPSVAPSAAEPGAALPSGK